MLDHLGGELLDDGHRAVALHALVAERRFREGDVEIDRGLALGADEPEKAYFNRALAWEGLDDMKAAWLDYQKALEIRPDWDAPRRELTRFTVTRE